MCVILQPNWGSKSWQLCLYSSPAGFFSPLSFRVHVISLPILEEWMLRVLSVLSFSWDVPLYAAMLG